MSEYRSGVRYASFIGHREDWDGHRETFQRLPITKARKNSYLQDMLDPGGEQIRKCPQCQDYFMGNETRKMCLECYIKKPIPNWLGWVAAVVISLIFGAGVWTVLDWVVSGLAYVL